MSNEMKIPIQNKIFGLLFLCTGVFCIVSSVFTWGEGWLFSISNLDSILIPMTDFIATGPLSLISAYGILKMKNWGTKFGLITAGTYIYGSVLVFIVLLWKGPPYPFQLIIPSISGFAIAVSFFIYEYQIR